MSNTIMDLEYHNCSQRLRNNNFDLLRLQFALTVCLIHAYQLSGDKGLKWIAQILSSKIAVEAFFVISGFLIFMSYERTSSLGAYVAKRIRRIYPAYFTIIILCAILLPAIATTGTKAYFSIAWAKYVLANISFANFLQPSLPGMFTENRLAAINGALWTLKIEVMFYAAVPIFVYLFRRFGYLKLLIAFYILSFAYIEIMTHLADSSGNNFYQILARQLPGQLNYFMSGAFLYYFFPLFERYAKYFLGFGIAVFVFRSALPLDFIEPFALAVIVVFFGLFLYVGNIGKYGDFSYGIYIIHFPVIQIILDHGWFHGQPAYYLTAVLISTTTLAALMWHFVEKRFLFRNNHYIAATN